MSFPHIFIKPATANNTPNLLQQMHPGTAYAVAKMIELTQKMVGIPSSNDFAAYSDLIISCCESAAKATSIEQLNVCFTQNRLEAKANTYLSAYVKRLDGTLIRNRPRGDTGSYFRQVKKILFSKLGEISNYLAEAKAAYSVTANRSVCEAKFKEVYRALDPIYRDEMYVIVDTLGTGIAIAQFLFVERMVRNLDEKSEFYQLLGNLYEKDSNPNFIKNKSYDLYKFFYKKELGNITDETLYSLAVALIAFGIGEKKGDTSKFFDAVQFKLTPVYTKSEMETDLERWIGKTAKDYPDEQKEINAWIAGRIVRSSSDPHIALAGLRDLQEYTRIYNETVKFNKAIEQRARYLRGEVD